MIDSDRLEVRTLLAQWKKEQEVSYVYFYYRVFRVIVCVYCTDQIGEFKGKDR